MSVLRVIRRGVSWLVATSVGAFAIGAMAQPTGSAEAQVLATLKSTYQGTRFNSVSRTPIAGIYEVVMGDKIAYTDTSGRFFLFGNLVDLHTQANLTEDRQAQLQGRPKLDPKSLPLEQAIKTVKGDGSRVLYVFADPQCGYCRQLEKNLEGVNNVTVYTFLLPILGPRSVADAESIWCARDRTKAWANYMAGAAPVVSSKCDNPLSKNAKLAEDIGIRGTPALIAENGRLVPGAMPADRIEALLRESRSQMADAGSK